LNQAAATPVSMVLIATTTDKIFKNLISYCKKNNNFLFIESLFLMSVVE